MKSDKYIYIAIIVFIYVLYTYNIKNKEDDALNADKNKFSNSNLYKNITPFKHDVFKQWTVDFLPLLLFQIIPKEDIPMFDTVMGKMVLSGLGFFMFYHFNQPYIVNNLPNF
jgi:hypothetical protein